MKTQGDGSDRRWSEPGRPSLTPADTPRLYAERKAWEREDFERRRREQLARVAIEMAVFEREGVAHALPVIIGDGRPLRREMTAEDRAERVRQQLAELARHPELFEDEQQKAG